MAQSLAEVLWIARYDYQPDWVLKRHTHAFYQIIYVISGEGIFRLDQKEYNITGNTVFFISPNQSHEISNKSKLNLKTLDIKFDIENNDLKESIKVIHHCIDLQNSEIKFLLERIKKEGKYKESLYKDFSSVYLQQIILTLSRLSKSLNIKNDDNTLYKEPRENNILGTKIIDFIEDHYISDISLEDISKSIAYNKSYICQGFKKLYNASPINYLYKFRIKKSKELILYADYSFKQISIMVGFKSIHHFARLFHKYEGMTPGQFRNTEKNDVCKDICLNENFKNQDLTNNKENGN